jgi:hypothetical protein
MGFPPRNYSLSGTVADPRRGERGIFESTTHAVRRAGGAGKPPARRSE